MFIPLLSTSWGQSLYYIDLWGHYTSKYSTCEKPTVFVSQLAMAASQFLTSRKLFKCHVKTVKCMCKEISFVFTFQNKTRLNALENLIKTE